MRRLFAIGLLICISALVAASQRNERFTKDVNADGWLPPTLKHLKIGEERAIELDGTSVIRTTYLLGEDGPSVSISGNKHCEFRSLRSYQVDDQVVAIEGSCVIFSVQTSKSKRFTVSEKTYYGAMTTYTFIDEDRNGTFESRYNGSGYLKSVIIPPSPE